MRLYPFKPYVPNRSETAQKAVIRWFTWCAVVFSVFTGYVILSARYWNPPSTPAKSRDAYLAAIFSAVLAGVCWLLVWMCRTNRITATWADDDDKDDNDA